MIDHGALTDLVISQISTVTGELVGDGIAPAGGGWLQGQPNQNVFVPYTVVVSAGATVEIDGLDGRLDFIVNWSLRHFGGSRKQCDWIAQKSRDAIDNEPSALITQTFGVDTPYKIIDVRWQNLGAVTRIDTVNPAFWQSYDSFGIVCARQGY